MQPSDRVVFYTDGIEQASACVRSPIGSSADAVEDLVRTEAGRQPMGVDVRCKGEEGARGRPKRQEQTTAQTTP